MFFNANRQSVDPMFSGYVYHQSIDSQFTAVVLIGEVKQLDGKTRAQKKCGN